MLEVIQIPVLIDNYIYLLHDAATHKTAVVDPTEAEPVLAFIEQKGWSLDYIFNTHHHWDHIGGNQELKEKTGCSVLASAYDQNRIPAIDQTLAGGDSIKFGKEDIEIIATPGHTSGHIVYFCRQQQALFCGDTLFSLGCGRLFEGSAEQMFQSLQTIKALPDDTKIYCAHEYTQTNARFALSVEPDNEALILYSKKIDQLRAQQKTTIPSTLAQEKACNPFLRTDSATIRQSLGMPKSHEVEVFAQLRKLKDLF
jgi:hydroxyacylglutathione hydrolase